MFGYKDYDKADYFGGNSMWNLWIMFGTPLAQTLLLTWHARPRGGGGGEAISHKVIHTLCHASNPIIKIGM